jgi:hypothetical protein
MSKYRVQLHQLSRAIGLFGYGVFWNHSPEQPLTHAAVQHTVSIALLCEILHRARAAGPKRCIIGLSNSAIDAITGSALTYARATRICRSREEL